MGRRRTILLAAVCMLATVALFTRSSRSMRPPPRAESPAEPYGPRADAQEPAESVVRGRTVSGGGEPVASARVRLLTPWSRGEDEAVTGDDGTFAAPWTRAGLVRCFASAPGFVPAAGPWIEADGRTDVDGGTLVLERGALAISGRVVDPDGAGVPGIDLQIEAERPDEQWARRVDAWEDVETQSGERGEFAFAGLREGLYRVRAHLDDEIVVTVDHVEAGTEDLRIVATDRPPTEETFHVRVTVTLPDGEPLPRGLLGLQSPSSGTSVEIIDGKAEQTLEGTRPFAFFVGWPRSANGEPLPFRPVYVGGLPPGTHERDIALEPGGGMRGLVHTSGAPLPEAEVVAHPAVVYRRDLLREPNEDAGLVLDSYLSFDIGFKVTTAADGRFELCGLFPGDYNVEARLKGFRMARGMVPARAGDEEVVLELVAAVRQEVLVQAPEGARLGGGHLMLWELTSAGPAYVTYQGVSVGRRSRASSLSATFADLTPGASYRLVTTPSAPLAPAVTEFVAVGETVLVELSEGAFLTGRVVREDGSPVPGAVVQTKQDLPPWADEYVLQIAALLQPKTTTDLAGRFRLEGLPDDPQALLASAPGLVQADVSGTEIVLVPAAGISGRIVPAQRPDLRVEYWRARPGAAPELFDWNLAGADGFFRHDALAPGAYRIVVWNVTHDDDDRCIVTEPVTAGTHGLSLAFGPGSRIEGMVAGSVYGMTVRLEADGWTRTARTDSRGRFVLRAIPEGSYTLRPILATGPGPATKAAAGAQVKLRVE